MATEQLKAAIKKPLALAGARAEAGLIDSLLADAGAEPGNMALLEHALGQLWERRDRASSILTSDDYTKIGRLKGSLGRHAGSVLNGIRDGSEKLVARRIFLDLVQLGEGSQDTRRRVHKKALYHGDDAVVDKLLDVFARQRLISTSGSGPLDPKESYVEVSHEALIREWPALRTWLDASRADLGLERRLLDAAGEWDKLERHSSVLLRGLLLGQAEEWASEGYPIDPLLRDFIEASHTEKDEAERREREAYERELSGQRDLQKAAEARARAEEALRKEAEASAKRSS